MIRWPPWRRSPGPSGRSGPEIQTPHGNMLIALMGDYYRTRFVDAGLLSGDPAKDGPLVYLRADNDQRTIETARIIGKALVQAGEPEVHSLPEGTKDPLFRAEVADVGRPDRELAAAAIRGRLGGDPANIDRAYAAQLAELKGILFGPGGPPADSPFNMPTTISAGEGSRFLEFSGPLLAAEICTDAFILEYTDGKPANEVGWGKVDGKVITRLLGLHDLLFDLEDRTYYLAQVQASNLTSHIIDTLEQATLGQPVPGALGPAGEKVVVIGGHDSNISEVGGLLGLNWWIPGSPMDPTFPAGALVFELWKRGGQDSYFVRVSYVAPTLDQARDAIPFTADNPPARAPIYIPGCSGPGPGYDAPLASFVRQARKVIDPSFIAQEP